jgi:hypothetical protein
MCTHNPYRIIWHEVGHALQYTDFPITPENVLKKAVLPVTRTQVDCFSWLGHTYLGGPYDMPRMWRDNLDPTPYEYVDPQGRPMGMYMENARPDADHYRDEGQRRRYGTSHELWKQGVDVVDLVSDAARRYGMDFTLAFRMNDYHHGSWEEHPRWWIENRHMNVGRGCEPEDDSPAAARRISGLDFTHPEVREHVIAPIVAAAECYDVDGIDLDFSRSRPYFPPGEEKPECLTELIREVRRQVEPSFRKRGRDVLILARIYEPPIGDDAGMDWRTWFAEGLVDSLSIGRTYGTDLRDVTEAGQKHGVKVYAGFDCIGFDLNDTKDFGKIEYFRASCLNYYHQGVDGIFFFNGSAFWSGPYPGPVARSMPHLMEVGDPGCMERRSKIYTTNWHKDHPAELVWSSDVERCPDGVSRTFEVSDNLRDSVDCGDLERVTLKAEFKLETPWISELNEWHLVWGRLDRMEYLLNGEPIEPEPIQKDELTPYALDGADIMKNWTRTISFDLTRGPLPVYGENVFSVRLVEPDEQLVGPRDLLMGRVDLCVDYGEVK